MLPSSRGDDHFNGAADIVRGSTVLSADAPTKHGLLQWGRGHRPRINHGGQAVDRLSDRASMGPRTSSADQHEAEKSRKEDGKKASMGPRTSSADQRKERHYPGRPILVSFNGAADIVRGSTVYNSVGIGVLQHASMGPRTSSADQHANQQNAYNDIKTLQWGRGHRPRINAQ